MLNFILPFLVVRKGLGTFATKRRKFEVLVWNFLKREVLRLFWNRGSTYLYIKKISKASAKVHSMMHKFELFVYLGKRFRIKVVLVTQRAFYLKRHVYHVSSVKIKCKDHGQRERQGNWTSESFSKITWEITNSNNCETFEEWASYDWN